MKSIITSAGSIAFDNDSRASRSPMRRTTPSYSTSGVTSTSGANSVAIGTSSVSVNDGAMEVM